MQSILSTHVRPEVFGHLFRLNLTVVRSVSGLPGLVRASPALFHKLGSFVGVRSTIRVRLLGFGLASRKRFGFVFLRLFWMYFSATAAVVVFVVVFTTISRLVAPNKIDLSHFT